MPRPMIFPASMGREGEGIATRPRAAMTMRRRTADSAGRSTRSAAVWRGRGIRSTMASSTSPSMANSDSMIAVSASLLRVMALAQSIGSHRKYKS